MLNIQKIIITIFRSTLIVYLVLALIWFYCLDHKEALAYARGSTLSRIIPNFEYFINFADRKVDFDKEKWQAYEFYFQKASRMMPLRPDVYGLLSYTYFNVGKKEAAYEVLLRGIKLNPHFFWYRYNLGVMDYKQGRYAEAADSFNNALGADLNNTVQFIYQAKMFIPILILFPDHQAVITAGFKNTYKNLYEYMIQSYLKLNDYDRVYGSAFYAISQKIDGQDLFYYYAGFAKFQLKDYAQAMIFFDECIKLNPHFAEAYYYLSLSMKEVGKADLARIFLQKSVDTFQKSGSSLKNIENQMVLRVFW